MMKKSPILFLAVGLLAGLSVNAVAVSTTGKLDISAIVPAQCVVQSAALPFGVYASSALQQNAQIGVACSAGTSYTISLDSGTGAGGNVAARKLTTADGANSLNYGLYQDAARTRAWGNSSGSDTVAGVGNGSAQNLPVYGYIPAGQAVRAGSYSDVVAITLSY
jgi:spore coat protein U-like protein